MKSKGRGNLGNTRWCVRRQTGRHKICLICQTWRKIYPVYPFSSTPSETHTAKKMSAAYVNSEYPDQSVHRHRQTRTMAFYQRTFVSKNTRGDEIMFIVMFTFQQSLTHGRSPDGIHINMRIKISKTRIVIKHLIAERICHLPKRY